MVNQRSKGRKTVEKTANALQRLEVQYVPIMAVHPNTYNPNRQSEHEFDLLLRSMQEDGFTQPIIVMLNGTIVDGEHRWLAASKLGMTEIPVVYVDMTEEQRRIATLRHNRARGTEDIDLTAALLKDLESLGALAWAQDSLMLSDIELNRLLEDIRVEDALAGDDYTEAWDPGRQGERLNDTVNLTPQAVLEKREADRQIAAAQTQQERAQARQEVTSLYRLAIGFTAQEAEDVKAVLQDQPAANILRLCREELARSP